MSLDGAGLPDESIEVEVQRWITYVRREVTYLTPRQFRGGRRVIKVRRPDLAYFLADAAEQALSGEIEGLRIAAGEAEALAEIVRDAPCVDESHHAMEADLAKIRTSLAMFNSVQHYAYADRARLAIALLNDIRRIVQ